MAYLTTGFCFLVITLTRAVAQPSNQTPNITDILASFQQLQISTAQLGPLFNEVFGPQTYAGNNNEPSPTTVDKMVGKEQPVLTGPKSQSLGQFNVNSDQGSHPPQGGHVYTELKENITDRPVIPEVTTQALVGPENTAFDNKGPNNAVDGVWSKWLSWGPCDVSCGNGTRFRFRFCDNPPALHGGIPCSGQDYEAQSCSITECPEPVHGGWTAWTPWSACDVSCGTGKQRRVRDCTNPAPSNGGIDCYEHFEEFQECVLTPCPDTKRITVDSLTGPATQKEIGMTLEMLASENQAFTQNSITKAISVGPDYVNQPSQVKSQIPLKQLNISADISGSTTVNASLTNTAKQQNNGVKQDITLFDSIMQADQKIDGVWSQWLSWGPCDVSCGNGTRFRFRVCDNPPALHGGIPCSGQDYEAQSCSITECPVDGGWSDWFIWQQCDRSCGNGSSVLIRTCDNPVPANGGQFCKGHSKERRECNTQLCPVDGGWSDWTVWEQCDRTCGIGTSIRSRKCDNPVPNHGGRNCNGLETDRKPCSMQACPVDGGWSPWTRWLPCDRTCGNGSSIRSRSCNSPVPAYGGHFCTGPDIERNACNLGQCPVDGMWRPWSSWSKCSTSCGQGMKVRARKCNGPSYGGKNCIGTTKEKSPCSMRECPVNGGWSIWSTWSGCDRSCDSGRQQRTRECSNPKPEFGGSPCEGKAIEWKQCNSQPCVVDGKWSPWTPWGPCDVTCGDGTQIRTRQCNNPAPSYGGLDCVGFGRQMQSCHRDYCPIPIGWEAWSQWSMCSVSCDIGLRRRQRVCNSTFIGKSGNQCTGDTSDYQICMPGACTDGGWTTWGQWSTCSKTCKTGTRSRIRTCSNPLPSVTGRYCVGEPSQTETCTQRECSKESVSFTVDKPATIIKGKLTFSRTLFNQGGDFNPLTGEFICTHPGSYFFSISLMKKRDFIRIDKVYCSLYKNNDTVIYTGVDPTDDDTDKGNAQAHNSVVIHLKYGDIVSLQGCNDPPTYYMENWSSYTGFLISPDS